MAICYQDFCKTAIEFNNLSGLMKLSDDLAQLKVILVMTKTAVARYSCGSFVEQLEKNCNLLWISDSVAYPTQETLLMGLERIRDFDADVIVSVGGGSSIDFAKGIKAFSDLKKECTLEVITECLVMKKICTDNDSIRLIAVPTTAGTGAELTQWATIWDCHKACKYSIDSPQLKPDKAIIIPEFTLKADEELTIATGVDSLAHAMEAYWSKRTNVLVRGLAGEAIRIIVKYLPQILMEPKNLYYREKQCLASILSGLAFSMTRTTACHSISYPLTMDYGILHGIAAAMTLEKVAEKNSGNYAEEKELLDIFKDYGGIGGFLQSLCHGRVSFFLKDYHVKKTDIPVIAQKSFTLGRMDNNPVELNEEDVREILCQIYTK